MLFREVKDLLEDRITPANPADVNFYIKAKVRFHTFELSTVTWILTTIVQVYVTAAGKSFQREISFP